MSACLFVASGANFDVDAYLTGSPFKPNTIFRRDDATSMDDPEGTAPLQSGFTMTVSQDDEPGLNVQMNGTLQFLSEHEEDFQRLREAGAETLLLDFGFEPMHALMKRTYFRPELIMALGRLRMGLMIDVFRIPEG